MLSLFTITRKSVIYIVTAVFSLSLAGIVYAAPIVFDGGFYTNLFGSGEKADNHTGKFCDVGDGSCEEKDDEPAVRLEKFQCDGKLANCDTGSIGTSNDDLSIDPDSVSCDNTVQIDVWDKACFDQNGYDCPAIDYIVWYKPCEEEAKQPPICVLEYEPKQGFVPLTVNFDGSKSSDPDGEIVDYEWTFSGDVKKEGQKVSQTFINAGDELVSLVVTDNDGNKSTNKCEANVKVDPAPPINQKPVCKIVSANPSEGDVPFTVKFDGSGSFDPDGTIISYFWDFGDGSTGSGVTTEHEYTKDGNFTATLVLEDNLLDQSSRCEAKVNAKGEEDDDNDDDDDDDNDDDDDGDEDNGDDGDDENGGAILASATVRSPETGNTGLYVGLYIAILGVLLKVLISKMQKEGYNLNAVRITSTSAMIRGRALRLQPTVGAANVSERASSYVNAIAFKIKSLLKLL